MTICQEIGAISVQDDKIKFYFIPFLVDFNNSFNMHNNVNTQDDELVGSSDQNGMTANSDHSIKYPSRIPVSPMTNTVIVSTFY